MECHGESEDLATSQRSPSDQATDRVQSRGRQQPRRVENGRMAADFQAPVLALGSLGTISNFESIGVQAAADGVMWPGVVVWTVSI